MYIRNKTLEKSVFALQKKLDASQITVNMSLLQKPDEEKKPGHKAVLLCLVQTRFQGAHLMIYIKDNLDMLKCPKLSKFPLLLVNCWNWKLPLPAVTNSYQRNNTQSGITSR
jgi:hypothetical protein